MSLGLQKFVEQPKYTEVNPGEDALLTCKIIDKRGSCSWQKDNKVCKYYSIVPIFLCFFPFLFLFPDIFSLAREFSWHFFFSPFFSHFMFASKCFCSFFHDFILYFIRPSFLCSQSIIFCVAKIVSRVVNDEQLVDSLCVSVVSRDSLQLPVFGNDIASKGMKIRASKQENSFENSALFCIERLKRHSTQ